MARPRGRDWGERLGQLAQRRRCQGCTRPEVVCVCDRLRMAPACAPPGTALPGTAPPSTALPAVWVLRHPGEIDHVLGTAPLLARLMPGVHIVDGLSWRSFAAVGEQAGAAAEVAARRWAVLWPLGWPAGAPTAPVGGFALLPPSGQRADVPVPAPTGLVVLDGTWRQAKALWWRNPWLLTLARMRLAPRAPTLFGRLRRAPGPAHLSTLESTAAALEALGVPAGVPDHMRRCLRTLTQRVRDLPGA